MESTIFRSNDNSFMNNESLAESVGRYNRDIVSTIRTERLEKQYRENTDRIRELLIDIDLRLTFFNENTERLFHLIQERYKQKKVNEQDLERSSIIFSIRRKIISYNEIMTLYNHTRCKKCGVIQPLNMMLFDMHIMKADDNLIQRLYSDLYYKKRPNFFWLCFIIGILCFIASSSLSISVAALYATAMISLAWLNRSFCAEHRLVDDRYRFIDIFNRKYRLNMRTVVADIDKTTKMLNILKS